MMGCRLDRAIQDGPQGQQFLVELDGAARDSGHIEQIIDQTALNAW